MGDVIGTSPVEKNEASVETGGQKVGPTEMELRVARAMYDANPAKHSGFLEWDQLDYGYQIPWFHCARAAIRAMREPTAGMIARVDAFSHTGNCPTCGGGIDAWRAMIDAACMPVSTDA